MANPFGLYFDGDLRRIYEVPENSSFSVDGDGYRTYVPDDIPSAEVFSSLTSTEVWSQFVDWREIEEWSTKAFEKTGGALADVDAQGNEIYDVFSLRLIEGWQFIIADYPHEFRILGNVRKEVALDSVFDRRTITSPGVLGQIDFDPTSQILRSSGSDGFAASDRTILERLRRILEGDEEFNGSKATIRDKDTKEVLVEKDVIIGTTDPVHLREPV